jgi:tetratricopeptide (TPR) repeat protein
MRILIWSFVPRSPESAFWFHIKNGMETLGHQVITMDAFAVAALFGPKAMQRILLHAAEVYQVNVAMVLTQNFVEPWLLEALRTRGVTVVACRYDDCWIASPGGQPLSGQDLRDHFYLDRHCDLSVTASRHMASFLAGTDLPVPTYVPSAIGWQTIPANPLPLRPVVAYCGSPKRSPDGMPNWRLQVVTALAAAGLPLELHHDDWAKIPVLAHFARPTPTRAQLHDVFRTSAVNLSLASETGDKPYRGIKGLNLEIAAAGGMQITDPSDEVTDILEPGHDLEFADGIPDFVAKARHYVTHLDEAARMGQNSRQAVEQNGGWEVWWNRVADLLATKGIVLDLVAPPVSPSAEEAQWLLTVYTALAHAYEAEGKSDLARVYFDDVLAIDPDDYAANAGMARLAAAPDGARPHWRRAARSIGPTLPVHQPSPLAMKGVGKLNTAFQVEAALNWLMTAMQANDPDDVLAALELNAPYFGSLIPQVAERLWQAGHLTQCRKAIEIGLQVIPDAPTLARLSRQLQE